ncbi:hypothetical protein [Ramlibacter sp. AN1133]|uniref:hypothetical protein n=1 Tax=Ramlibacter sp. AN1133 TaxID=3133429 RepID=UPI0030BF7139
MSRFKLRMVRSALVALSFLGLGCAAAGQREVRLAPEEWRQVHSVLAWPRDDLPIREVRALQVEDGPNRWLEVEVASGAVERTEEYRTWWRASCSTATGAWKCEPAEEMVEPAGGGAVALGPQASPQDVVRLARLLGHHPGWAAERELLSVRAAGAQYVVSFRLGACEHLVRLRAEGGMFLLDPYEREIRACR